MTPNKIYGVETTPLRRESTRALLLLDPATDWTKGFHLTFGTTQHHLVLVRVDRKGYIKSMAGLKIND